VRCLLGVLECWSETWVFVGCFGVLEVRRGCLLVVLECWSETWVFVGCFGVPE